MFEKMLLPDRVKAAKEKTRRVVDYLVYLLELHENNAIVLYSPTLSAQIPISFAANAFNVFQQGLHQFEIVRLCALWDRAEPEKENVPTIIELIDHPDVIESLAQETAAHWQGLGGSILNPSDDPELRALEADTLQRSNQQFGQEQAQKARDELRKAIEDSRVILASAKHASIMNLRDKHLAHSLSKTRRERKVGRRRARHPRRHAPDRGGTLLLGERHRLFISGQQGDRPQERQGLVGGLHVQYHSVAMFARPIKGDLDRSLSMLMHEARHKLTDECNQIKSVAIKAGALQSTRVIVTAATTADEQHQDAMKQTKPMLLDFIERMQGKSSVTPATRCCSWNAGIAKLLIIGRNA
jgi:hypothetical protein